MPKCSDCGNIENFKGHIEISGYGNINYIKEVSNNVETYYLDDVTETNFKVDECAECGSQNIHLEDNYSTEWCPHCQDEVKLPLELGKYKCPNCNEEIINCSQCLNDDHTCSSEICPFERKNPKNYNIVVEDTEGYFRLIGYNPDSNMHDKVIDRVKAADKSVAIKYFKTKKEA